MDGSIKPSFKLNLGMSYQITIIPPIITILSFPFLSQHGMAWHGMALPANKSLKEETSLTVDQPIETTISGSYLDNSFKTWYA